MQLNFFVSIVFVGQMLNGFDDNLLGKSPPPCLSCSHSLTLRLKGGFQALLPWRQALGNPSQSDIGLLSASAYISVRELASSSVCKSPNLAPGFVHGTSRSVRRRPMGQVLVHPLLGMHDARRIYPGQLCRTRKFRVRARPFLQQRTTDLASLQLCPLRRFAHRGTLLARVSMLRAAR